MMQAIAESGAGFSGASAVHMNIFGLNPVVVFGTDEQKRRMLPPLIAGRGQGLLCRHRARCRPRHDAAQDAGGAARRTLSSTGRQDLDLDRPGGEQDPAARAHHAASEASKPTEGLSLFYTDLDRRFVEVREIEKMGRKAVDSNQLFIDGLTVPVADRIGEEGRGFEYILHGMNPERILIAAEAIGLGRAALQRAADYAKSRVVFDRPIGQNQAIQHPLAKCWMELEAANLMVFRAARSTTPASPAAPRRMPPNISPAKPAFRPARRR